MSDFEPEAKSYFDYIRYGPDGKPMTDTPAQAPADPGAIDLKLAGYNYALAGSVTRLTIFNQVSDAVEALQDQLAQQSIDLVNAGDDNEELRERVAELEAHNNAIQEAADFNLQENLALAKRMAEAAEAGRAELAGALAHLIEFADQTGQGNAKQQEDARAALAATPEEVMERARAESDVITAARAFMNGETVGRELSKALDSLDALKEGG